MEEIIEVKITFSMPSEDVERETGICHSISAGPGSALLMWILAMSTCFSHAADSQQQVWSEGLTVSADYTSGNLLRNCPHVW